jgi:outer membrane protein assembly factor BamB
VTRSGSEVMVTEDARLPSGVAAFSMPGSVNSQVVEHHGGLFTENVPMWRQTTTFYGGDQKQASGLMALTGPGIVQLAYATERLALVFDPPMLVLPHDPEDGQEWTDEGDAAAGLIDYRATTSLKRKGTCWAATSSVSFTNHATGEAMGSIPGESRICPGRGVLVDQPTTAPRLADTGTQQTDPLTELARLTEAATLPLVSPSPIGELTMGSIRLDVAPVSTGDGRLVLADANSRDLVSTSRDGKQLTIGWRAHPGGAVTSLVAVGEVVVAGTSERNLCAYRADGAWLWCRELGDLVDRPGVALDSRTVAVLGQDGVLRAIDVLTGKERWRVRGVDTALTPVRVGQRVVVAERDGTLRAWDSRTGKKAWTTESTDVPELLTTSGEEILVAGELVTRYDAEGDQRSQHVLRISVSDGVMVGDTTVITGSDGTRAYDRAGHRLWTAPRWRTVLSDGTGLLAVQGGSALVLDPETGDPTKRWALPDQVGTWWTVPLAGDRVLVHSGAAVVGLS